VGTDGAAGGRYETAEGLATQIESLWPDRIETNRLVVLTGGEPLLQVDTALIEQLHRRNFQIAVETNGTLEPPAGVDWVCVSPKAGSSLKVSHGHELKVVWPQLGIDLSTLEQLNFEHLFLQPMDDIHQSGNIRACINVCLARPKWRLSLQSQKIIGVK
jgi:7-carboxy-7-deazaguanine synthase (Cx14CxxC type)